MNIIKANKQYFECVKNIIHSTIKEIYPKYYPLGAVNYFLNHHSDKNILNAITNKEVYLLTDNKNNTVGTGSINKNEICRLFVTPEYQGNGYGTLALNYFENTIFKNYTDISLASSFPAYNLYLKRGYQPTEYHKIRTKNGDYLCYHIMVLTKS